MGNEVTGRFKESLTLIFVSIGIFFSPKFIMLYCALFLAFRQAFDCFMILHHYLSNSRTNPLRLFSGIWNLFFRTGKMVKRQAKPTTGFAGRKKVYRI
jgi:hypothetical protein